MNISYMEEKGLYCKTLTLYKTVFANCSCTLVCVPLAVDSILEVGRSTDSQHVLPLHVQLSC